MMEKAVLDCGLLDLHNLLGKKWTYGLLFNINEKPLSFTELEALSNKEINPTMLSERLKGLESFSIIKKEAVGSRVYYAITDEGKKLKDLLVQIKSFSSKVGCTLPEKCAVGDCTNCKDFRRI